MNEYQKPQVVATYAADDLLSEAVMALSTSESSASDRALKEYVTPIEKPLGGLKDVRTRR